jgi:GlpG protein
LLQEYSKIPIVDYLAISDLAFPKDLPEVRAGQLWRLLTPIFLHFHILHIFFNMLWLRDLGTIIESISGTLQLLLLVLVTGIISNVAQYFTDWPALFGGMSGVVYALLGYIWIRGKFDLTSGYFLHPSTVMMMILWLVLGYIPHLLPFQMANSAHLAGLASGAAWGYLAARFPRA